ncbi:uncharacterized protein ATC70_006168 [Mucor velutinosus]|uniref:Uncharacterized protein n=1 Tax=Mucor velutinosus TaxID=708070 RepID=A0AAN7D564_9FUNG|nr:hypothetical protein ATC70_006168 [Mucor velutinosus]
MDFVFIDKKTELEIGCGEGALVGGVNTTKQLYDAKFKMPKVLRDMIIKLVSRSPALKKDLHVCGFYVAETDLQLFILDCPSTYVTRLDAMKEMHYPKSEGQIHRQLSAVLRNIIGLRIIMENTVYALDHDTTDITIGRDNDEAMIPCFIPSSPEKKKRKFSVATSINS